MKFYESTFEEYLASVDKYNIHDELTPLFTNFSKSNFENMIIYGPSGIGKYSQVLKIIKPYSPSELKYEKKIIYQIDKQEFIYHISDIHYEIDMSLLGCNSKNTWYEIFCQIVDIISMKTNKTGIIVCKNFHMIHNELLEIFYSYIQQYNHPSSHIQIKFILLTEHVSFIPNNIVNACKIISISRPSKFKYMIIGFMYKKCGS
jgi:Cdc6-like AAA superfamily ATPase